MRPDQCISGFLLTLVSLVELAGTRYIEGVSTVIEEDIYFNDKTNVQLMSSSSVPNNPPWPNNAIAYHIDDTIRADKAALTSVKIAMVTLEDSTDNCVRFQPRTSSTEDYINITRSSSGSVGKLGGEQTVNIGLGCDAVGVIMHELLHALGFWHEQNRSDRDNYVDIYYGNILFGRNVDFEKRSDQTDLETAISYDFYSIMHYKYNQFAKLKTLDTIVPKTKYSVDKTVLGQREKLSDLDIERIKWMYKCGKYALTFCKPPVLDYGTYAPMEDVYSPGTEISFSCNSGYLVGPKNSTCQKDGTWSGATPFCVRAYPETFSYCDMENGCFSSWYSLYWSSKKAGWQQFNGSTPTPGTGPSYDHTYNSVTANYLLFEADDVSPGDFALIVAPRVAPRSGDGVCVLFYYYMYGEDIGTMTVYANWAPVFHKQGSGKDEWTRVLIPRVQTWNSVVRIMFHAQRGRSNSSDVAIDDVLIGPCSEVNRYEKTIQRTQQTS